MFLFLITLLSFNSYSMCDYPHNPPVICAKGKVRKVKVIKHSKFKCLISLKAVTLIRPKNTYYFDKELDKQIFKKNELLIQKDVQFYSSSNCISDEVITTLEYNCSDKYKTFKDLELIDLNQKKGNVLDQWTEKKHFINCSSILSN